MYKLKHYMAVQMVEILEHKYYLSEQAGYDVGIEATLKDWVNSPHAKRFHEAYLSNLNNIETIASKYNCVPACLVHMILND